MSTRAEQVEACERAAMEWLPPIGVHFDAEWVNLISSRIAAAAATLTRDGELLDRLKKLLLDMEQDCDARSWAQDIEALMKETSDEG